MQHAGHRAITTAASAAIVLLLLAGPAAGKTGHDYLKAAHAAEEAEKYQTAVRYLTSAISSGTLSKIELAGAYSRRGLCRLRLKQPDKAMSDMDKAIGIDRTNPAAYFSRGVAWMLQGRNEQAIADLSTSIELCPADPRARKILARTYAIRAKLHAQDGRYAKARDDRRKAIELNPADAESHLRLGYLYLLSDDHSKALTAFSQSIKLDATNAKAHAGRANVHLLIDKHKQAISDATQAIRLGYEGHDAYTTRGTALHATGHTDEGIADMTTAVKLCLKKPPKTLARVYYLRCTAYFATKQFAKSRDDASKVVELDPTRLDAHLHLGSTCALLGQNDRAVTAYTKAIELAPESFRAYTGRSAAHLAANEYDLVIADVDKAISMSPENWKEQWRLYLVRAVAHKAKSQYDRGIADATRVITLNPKESTAYGIRADCLALKGKLDEAMVDMNRAVDLDPKDDGIHVDRGWLYYRMNKYAQAVADLTKAINLNPKNDAACLRRGVMRFYAERHTAAIADFAASQRLRPDGMYPAIWLYLCRKRAGQDGSKELATFAKAHLKADSTWPAAVIRLYLGTWTPKQCLDAAGDKNKTIERRQKCEAWFYLGQYSFHINRPDAAKKCFEKCLARDVKDSLAHHAAKAELTRMGKK